MTNITQEALKELAIAQGKEISLISYPDEKDDFCYLLGSIKYEPHRNWNQCGPLLEWLSKECVKDPNYAGFAIEFEYDEYHVGYVWSGEGAGFIGDSDPDLKLAIVKAAISFIQEGK